MTKRNQNSRGYSLRKVNTREVRTRFLIVCEGKKTEPNYFRSFRVNRDVVEIDIKPGLGQQPSQLIKIAENENIKGDYDQVWCVFDRDNWTANDFNNAIISAKNKGFKVAYSNEAFELWYVLHFEFLNAGINRKDYVKKLNGALSKQYLKNSETIYDELLNKQDIAIKNAIKLLSQYQSPIPAINNSSTTVHLLVQELNKFIH
jgi:hypothetical protein